MSNPFFTGNFVCCDCPDPDDGKYLNRCGCPEVVIECESEARSATMCGFVEFAGASISPSTPPRWYKTQTHAGTIEVGNSVAGNNNSNIRYHFSGDKSGGSASRSFDADCVATGSFPFSGQQGWGYVSTSSTSGPCDHLDLGSRDAGDRTSTPITTTTARLSKATLQNNVDSNGWQFCTDTGLATLSDEATEQEALDRATPVEASSCSSLYQLRTTSSSFTVRTVKYFAKARNLCPGRQYQGCVRIRRREAYAGTPPAEADTSWDEVAPDLIDTFTADPDEDGWTIIDEDVALPNEQGFEYEIMGASIWPVGSGCECPTEYEPEAE